MGTVHDRAALIGDPRNDENTIIAQLHVAFLNLLGGSTRSNSLLCACRKATKILHQH